MMCLLVTHQDDMRLQSMQDDSPGASVATRLFRFLPLSFASRLPLIGVSDPDKGAAKIAKKANSSAVIPILLSAFASLPDLLVTRHWGFDINIAVFHANQPTTCLLSCMIDAKKAYWSHFRALTRHHSLSIWEVKKAAAVPLAWIQE